MRIGYIEDGFNESIESPIYDAEGIYPKLKSAKRIEILDEFIILINFIGFHW